MTDKQLLDDYLAGHPEALERLIRAHIDMVYATARRHVGGTHADDITQAVFIMLIRKRDALRGRASLAGWMYRCTVYCCSNFKRTEARRRKHERESNAMDASATLSPATNLHELRELLDAAMARLSDSDREAVLLRHLEQKSLGETAAMLGITEEAARKRAGRGLERLRDYFVRKGLAVPAAGVATLLTSQAAIHAPAALTTAVLAGAKGAAISTSAAAAVKVLAGMYGWTQAKLAAIAAGVLLVISLAVAVPLLKKDQPPAAAPPIVPPPVAVVATAPIVAEPPPPPPPLPPQVIDVSADPAFKNWPYRHVTINFDSAKSPDAAAAFAKATGLNVVIDTAALAQTGNELPPLTMHVTDVPLMHAVLQLSRVAHAYPSAFDTGRLTLRAALEDTVNAPATVGRWSVAGPFAAEVASIEAAASPAARGRGGAIGGGPGAGGAGTSVMMRMNFFAEPGMPVLRYPDAVTIDEFVDENGHDIATAQARGTQGRASGNLPRTQMSLPLTLPVPAGTHIVSFRGKATYLMGGANDILKTESLDEQHVATAGGMKVEIMPAARTEPPLPTGTKPSDIANAPTLSLYHFQVRFHRADLDDTHWSQMLTALPNAQMTILNVFDKRVTSGAAKGRPVMDGTDTLVLEYTAASAPPQLSHSSDQWKNLEPHHVQLDVPSSSVPVAVPFKFTDLPLP